MLIIKKNHDRGTIRYHDILEEKKEKDIQILIYLQGKSEEWITIQCGL